MSEFLSGAPTTTELEKQYYQEFENFNAIDIPCRAEDYQRAGIFVGFDMLSAVTRLRDAYGLLKDQQYYLVVFRSQRNPGLTEEDIDLLATKDHLAHKEAHDYRNEQGGQALLHYYKGLPDADGFCISWCVWTSEAIAKLASGKVHQEGAEAPSSSHSDAMRLARQMYQKYGIQTYRLRLSPDGESLEAECVQDTWSPQVANPAA